ncbi:MAG: redoxin family protein [Flavobacteriales bacterium]|nr:redoxin family protein [Flavobacteriales bacterium]
MKINLFILVLIASAFAFKTGSEYSNLKIGAKAPMTDHIMKDVSGTKLSLDKIKKDNGLLVIFSCNTCPFVIGNGTKSEGWENRYNDIARITEKMGVGSVLVNSNEAKRDKGDAFDDMVARAEEKQFISKYVLDSDHKLADAFGARTTPHVFLFDADMKLVYQGAIDDNVDRKKGVKLPYLKSALSSISEGEEVRVKETKPIGCSIKRVAAK